MDQRKPNREFKTGELDFGAYDDGDGSRNAATWWSTGKHLSPLGARGIYG
ncbi:MAG: hypothetical protein R2860_05610 [Desulfobacterales bacterium]